MPRKFNPLAAYGTVHPPHEGAVHYQDGGYFDPAGKLLFEDRPPTPPKVVQTEVIETDGVTGITTTTLLDEEVEEITPGDPKDILSQWLRGEVQLHFGTVVKQVKLGFNVVISTKAGVIDFLVNTANLVPAELVKVT